MSERVAQAAASDADLFDTEERIVEKIHQLEMAMIQRIAGMEDRLGKVVCDYVAGLAKEQREGFMGLSRELREGAR